MTTERGLEHWPNIYCGVAVFLLDDIPQALGTGLGRKGQAALAHLCSLCNEACKLAAKRGFRTLKGFVNAVLRNISRSKDKMPLPDPTDPVKYFSVKYSMPEWIVNLWLPVYGTEGTETLLMGLLKIHPVSLRFCLELSETDREDLKKKTHPAENH